MGDFIRGEERVLYIKVDDAYVPVGCLTSNPISENTETIETTTRQTNGWRTELPTKQSYSINFDGIQILTFGDDGDNTKLSYDRLRVMKRSRELVEWKIEDGDLRFIDIGYGYITEISEANEVGALLTFSGRIVGFGMPTAASTPGLYLFEDGQPFVFEDLQTYQFNI
jgi:predicted secreted protein